MLSYKDASALLSGYDILMPKIYQKDPKFPVVLKVDSQEVIHKTELGLVVVGIQDQAQLEENIARMQKVLEKNKIKKYSLLVQEQVKGLELLMGMKKDPSFGQVILFGLGGIHVEIFNDVSMRIAPLKKKDCLEMINEIRSSRLFDGFRNSPKIDKAMLVSLLMKLSELSMKEKNLKEIDFNPVIVNEKKIYVADARIIYA
ncbi:MAG: acetate--CoA ligase family protein [Candidatus Woesearchaeota archaeon]|nr:acetate--CoA ligase family protein [Candidatus Woesearchaeota archaeon]